MQLDIHTQTQEKKGRHSIPPFARVAYDCALISASPNLFPHLLEQLSWFLEKGSEQTAPIKSLLSCLQPPRSQSQTDSFDSGLLLLNCKQEHWLLQVPGGGEIYTGYFMAVMVCCLYSRIIREERKPPQQVQHQPS